MSSLDFTMVGGAHDYCSRIHTSFYIANITVEFYLPVTEKGPKIHF